VATRIEGAAANESTRFGEELFRAAARRATDIVELAAAESRLAALSGLAMILFVIFAGAALVIAWILLVGCVLFLFAQSRIGWPIPAFCFAVGHAALAYYLWQQTVRLSWNLTLPELRATLTTKPPTPEVPHGGELVPERP
jgi:DNA-binding IclR family transcriptional regulator